MSIALAITEIRRFLASAEPEVLCISGRWGVGKTFTWNHYLSRGAEAGEIGLERYSYVSLFGQNSLQDVRSSIFENVVALKRGVPAATVDSVKDSVDRGVRRLTKIAKLLPQFRGYSVVTERLLYAMLPRMIVCIDDLDRASSGLSKKDVLGIVSELREQKSCKVVLLLNDEALAGDKAEYDQQIEKVADVNISFLPTAAEASEIALADNSVIHECLRNYCTTLGIINIRVIKRIERLATRLQEALKGQDERVLKEALHSLALFTFSRSQPDIAPSIDFILDVNSAARRVQEYLAHSQGNGEEANQDPRESAWKSLLADYKFGHVDEFDHLILEGVDRGYFDYAALEKLGREKERQIKLADQDNSMSQAWNLYHDSFDNNQEQVLEALMNSFKANFDSVSPMNVNGLATLLKDLGRAQQSRELVEFYINHKEAPRDFWDLRQYAFRSHITDTDVIELFRSKFDSFPSVDFDPGACLVSISKNSGWNPEDVQNLANLFVDDFYGLFKNLRGIDLRRAVVEALRFQHRGPDNSPERVIADRANAALDRIASESEINKRRVEQRRIDCDR